MRSAVIRVHSSALSVLAICALAGCGISEQTPDLFLLQRTGQGRTLRLLVKDDGTVRCNGRAGTPLSDAQLLQARDLAGALDKDAKSGLHIAAAAGSIYTYTVKLQDGTISFADTSGSRRKELAQAELFTVQVGESHCPAGSA